jgi:hypothetical protein
VAALGAYRAARGLLDLDLVRDSALALSSLDGTHPEHHEGCRSLDSRTPRGS